MKEAKEEGGEGHSGEHGLGGLSTSPITPSVASSCYGQFQQHHKHVDYEDFLEHLCLLMLSEWIYTDPVKALHAGNDGGIEKGGEAIEEEKQESTGEQGNAVAAPGEEKPEPGPPLEPKLEPEPEKTMSQVLQERLSLFSTTYDRATPKPVSTA